MTEDNEDIIMEEDKGSEAPATGMPEEGSVKGDQGPPVAPQAPKCHTKDGIKLMSFAMVMMLVTLIVSTIVIIYTGRILADLTSGDRSMDVLSALARLAKLSYVDLGLMIFTVILAVLAIAMFHKGKDEVGPGHGENMKWAIIFFVGYLITLVAPYLMGAPDIDKLAARVAVTTTLSFLDNFFLAFMILFLVKDMAGPRERDLLYLFTGLMIILPFLSYAVPRALKYGGDLGEMVLKVANVAAVFVILKMLVIMIALLAYWSIKKDMDVHGLALPKDRPAFLPRIKPLDTYVGKFYSKPVVALVVMLVVAMVVGAAVGAQYYKPKDDGGDGGQSLRRSEEPEKILYLDAWSGDLAEGDGMVYNDTIEAEVEWIEVILTWSDESDYTLRTNEPDGFTLDVTAGGETMSDSGENPRNGEGELVVTFDMDPDDPPYVEDLEIMVTLDHCGDQEGPAGLGGPLTVVDDGNDFEVELTYIYYT